MRAGADYGWQMVKASRPSGVLISFFESTSRKYPENILPRPAKLLYSHLNSFTHMDIVNPAVTDGVDLFVNIVVFLLAFAAALSFIDFRKSTQKESEE